MSSGAEIERRPEKMSFSVTCNLFRQYIKDKGFRSDLGRGMTSSSQEKGDAYNRVPTTMKLLPGIEISGDDQTDVTDDISVQNAARSMAPPVDAKDPEKAQLTIFYGGIVFVVDSCPAEKAEDLMLLASKSSRMVSDPQSFSLMPLNQMVVGDRPSCFAPAKSPVRFPPRPQPNFSDLPIARKASLHRFLEKRKDRISAKAPYQMGSGEGIKSGATSKMGGISQPWLGLGSQISS